MAVGGFPDDVILGEDAVVASRMILSGWKKPIAQKQKSIIPIIIRFFRSLSDTLIQECFTTGIPGLCRNLVKQKEKGKDTFAMNVDTFTKIGNYTSFREEF